MTIELANRRVVTKPWGVADPGRWLKVAHPGSLIGEIWFERSVASSQQPSLLLKLLFSSAPLSIQVHPDDAYARSKGLASGKTEAWYVVDAMPDAVVALGLDQEMTQAQFRQALQDGSIAGHAAWRVVAAGDAISVPAGTIHAIGAGLVIAEIQQRSDATYRMFDHGRQRELHIDDAVAMAVRGPAGVPASPVSLCDERTLLASSSYFVFERIVLPPDTTWRIDAARETWLLVLEGGGNAGSIGLSQGDAIFAQSDTIDLCVGADGLIALAAYASSSPLLDLSSRSWPAERSTQTGHNEELPPSTMASSQYASAFRQSGFLP